MAPSWLADTLTFYVTYDESVTVTGTPALALIIGSSQVSAIYDAASSTGTELRFVYTIKAGENDSDGISVGALGLNGGKNQRSAGNEAKLTLTNIASTANVLVDSECRHWRGTCLLMMRPNTQLKQHDHPYLQ